VRDLCVCVMCVCLCGCCCLGFCFWGDVDGVVAGLVCECVMVLCLEVVSFGFFVGIGRVSVFDFLSFMFCVV